jgi:hypothetical protein
MVDFSRDVRSRWIPEHGGRAAKFVYAPRLYATTTFGGRPRVGIVARLGMLALYAFVGYLVGYALFWAFVAALIARYHR